MGGASQGSRSRHTRRQYPLPKGHHDSEATTREGPSRVDTLFLPKVRTLSIRAIPPPGHQTHHIQPRLVRGALMVARTRQVHSSHVHHHVSRAHPSEEVHRPRLCYHRLRSTTPRTVQNQLRGKPAHPTVLWAAGNPRTVDRHGFPRSLRSQVRCRRCWVRTSWCT